MVRSRSIGLAVALVLSACGSDLVGHSVGPQEAMPEIEAATPPPPLALRLDRSWIGKTRGDVESQVTAQPTAPDAEGWVTYEDGLRVRYDLNIVIGLAVRVPEGLGCDEAAKWMGFPSATRPLSRDGVCEWPGGAGHRLGHGHTGRMDPATRIIQVQLGS